MLQTPSSVSRSLQGLFGSTAIVVASNAPAAIIRAAKSLKASMGALVQICDGTADNVEIQAALDSLGASGGKVYLSKGTFVIASTVSIPTTTTLQGSGIQSTQFIDSSSTCTVMFQFAASAVRCVMRDMYIRGSSTPGTWTATYAIQGNSGNDKITLENIEVGECAHTGISFDDAGGAGHLIMDKVTVSNCTQRGVYLKTPHSTSIIKNCLFGNVVAGAITYMTSSALHIVTTTSILLDSNEFWGASTGLYVSGRDIHVHKCRGHVNKTYNFYFETVAHSSLVDCYSYAAGQDSGVGWGVLLNNSTYCTVDGLVSTYNLSYAPAGYTDNVQAYGIRETGTSDYNRIINSKALSGSTAALTYVGTHTKLSNNTGYVASGDVVSIVKVIDHASLTDSGGATAYIDFADAIPAGSIVKTIKCDFTEAFNSDDTTTLTMMIGSQADLDALNKTADPGENAFNHTTDVFWGESACQDPVVTTAYTPRVTFTEDDDGTDIINSANAAGGVTITITYMKA